MCETWVEEKGWLRLKRLLPKSHNWSCSIAERDKKRGRAKGGFIIGKIKGWGKDEGETSIKKEEGILITNIREKRVIDLGGLYQSIILEGWMKLRKV